MAIVSVRPLFEGRSSGEDWKFRRTGTRVIEVISDDVEETEATLLSAVDPVDASKKVPAYGNAHPGLPTAVCISKELDSSDETPYIHYVNCGYDSEPQNSAGLDIAPGNEGNQEGEGPGNRVENPLNRPASWKIGSIDRQEVVREWLVVDKAGTIQFYSPAAWVTALVYKEGAYVSRNGNVYVALTEGTSAGGPAGTGITIDGTITWFFVGTVLQVTTDPAFAIFRAVLNTGKVPFNPPNMTDVSIPTVIVTKNIPAIDLLYVAKIKNAVNVLPWKGLGARCAKVCKFDAGNKEENGFKFIEASWEIGIDPDTWDIRPMDQGFGFIEQTQVPNPTPPPDDIVKKRFVAFRDGSGEAVSEAVPMDGAGNMLDPTDDPVFLRGIPRQMRLLPFADFIPW